MLKEVRNILFAMILALSVLTPLVVNLFPVNEDIVLLSDFEEEDQKEGKKELEIKDLFFTEKKIEDADNEISISLISELYKLKIVSFPLEVISPPPEVDLILG